MGTGLRILWVGSAGLVHALAESVLADLPADRVRPGGVKSWDAGSTIIFAGSKHPVTKRQMDDLGEQRGSSNVVVVRVECGETTEDQIRNAVGARKAETVSCMVMTGGDTAMLVCRALGVESLLLHEEFEPGIPHATVVGGQFSGCMAILKSGGFGTVDVLSRIARRFSPEKAAAL
jgi:D-threonate/D-erythronate kinase